MGIHFSSTITFLNEQFKTYFASGEHLNVQICVSFHFVSNLIRRRKLCCSLHFYSIGCKRFRDVVSCEQRRQAIQREDTCTLRFLSQVDLNAASQRQKIAEQYIFLYLIESHGDEFVQCSTASAAKFKSAFAGWH